MPRGRFSNIVPNDNVYLVKTAADLPNQLSQWTIYNLTYKSGMFYSPDGVNLLPLGGDEGLAYFLGE